MSIFNKIIEWLTGVPGDRKGSDPYKDTNVIPPSQTSEPNPESVNPDISASSDSTVIQEGIKNTTETIKKVVEKITQNHFTIANYIVEIFETSKLNGSADSYGRVTLIKGDTGRLTYGKHQATLNSGHLLNVINKYIENKGSLAGEFDKFIAILQAKALSVDTDQELHTLLRRAGSDPVMQYTQDKYFKTEFSAPALKWFDRMECTYPLSYAIIYDSIIHGSWFSSVWGGMKGRTDENFGTIEEIGEKEWMQSYVETRRNWLAYHVNVALNSTVYRMDSFLALIEAGNWELSLPLEVHNIEIKKIMERETLEFGTHFTRYLRHKRLPMIGEDVNFVEKVLNKAGYLDEKHINASFNVSVSRAVKAFQKDRGLKADGIVGPKTHTKLSRFKV